MSPSEIATTFYVANFPKMLKIVELESFKYRGF